MISEYLEDKQHAAIGLSQWLGYPIRRSVVGYILICTATGLIAPYAMAEQVPDTLDSRTKAAARIVATMDVQSRIDEYVDKKKDLQPEEREKLRSLVKNNLRISVLQNLEIESLAKVFTTRELNALEAFWRTEEGRRILSKYGTYVSSVLPAVNAEIERDFAEVKVELEKDENRDSTSSHPREVPESAKLQHEKLRLLLESLYAIETSLQASEKRLGEQYANLEVTNVYQTRDLGTIDGIRTARQRLRALSAKYDGFATALEKKWAELESLVSRTDLAEPEASSLRASLSADEAETFPNYRAWFAATRADVVAIGRLVDTAERHVGKLKVQNNQLVSSDSRAASDLLAAQQALAAADHQYDQAARAALKSGNYTSKYGAATLCQFEQGLHRQYGTSDVSCDKSQ